VPVPRSGVGYEPILHWALAALAWGYTWEAFCALDGDDQAFLVAVYEAQGQIEGVIHKDVMRKAT
jgi:hypothetical protein